MVQYQHGPAHPRRVSALRDPRVIPLNAVALAALIQLKHEKSPPGTESIFPSARTGNSLQGSRGRFSTALDAAKILDYTWHCNRHPFASRLVMAGVDLRTVAELLGHRTLQMVMRHSHLGPEHQTSEIDRLVNFQGRKGHQNGHRRVWGENSKKHPNTQVI
jgi:integrase